MPRICHLLHGVYSSDPRVKREVSALLEAGYSVDVVCLHENGMPLHSVDQGAHIYRLPITRKRGSVSRYIFEYISFFLLASLFLVFHLHKKYKIIHVNNMPDFLVFTAMLPKLIAGSLVILDIHDPMPELFCSKYGLKKDSKVVKFLSWQEKMSVRFAHSVITVSEEMKDRLLSTSSNKPVSVVMNMPDEKIFERAIQRGTETVNQDKFRLLYSGTISERYGLATVIQAIARMRNKIPGLTLRLVGEGDQLCCLKELSERIGVSDIVEFYGRVPLSKIPEMIDESDLGLSALLSDDHTDLCFVTKVVEYLSLGLPTVISKTRTMANYYDNDLVCFFEPGNPESFEDAVVKLYNDPKLRAYQSQKGIVLGKLWNWGSEKKKYLTIINDLCNPNQTKKLVESG